jgi:hypothetical protein
MATIPSIRSNIAAQITNSSGINSISEGDVGNNVDALAQEVRDRGIVFVSNDTIATSHDSTDSKIVLSLATSRIFRHNGTSWVLVLDPAAAADTSAPFIIQAFLITSTVVRLLFNKKMQLSGTTGISISSPTNNPITAFSGSGTNTIDFTLTNAVASGTVVTFSYNSTLGDLRDTTPNENELQTISGYLAINSLKISSISELDDVGSISGATDGQALVFDGALSVFVPGDVSGSGGGALEGVL